MAETDLRVARYHRVSTERQSLQRQVDSTEEYCDRTFGEYSGEVYTDASTGTNTDRSGYQQLMEDVESGELDHVVIHEISRMARSIRDFNKSVDRLSQAGVTMHVVSEGLKIDPEGNDPMQKMLYNLLALFAEVEADMTRQRIKEGIAARRENDDYHHGPAPLGFEKEEGKLIESDEYEEVTVILEMVRKGEMSKRQAANELDCARGTIRNSLDRLELYGLETEWDSGISVK